MPTDNMPISDASEPYDSATRSKQYSQSRRWRDRRAQRETRTILFELAELEHEAARASAAAPAGSDTATRSAMRTRHDGHILRARDHELRAEQLVEIPLCQTLLDVSLPHPADVVAECDGETEALRALDANCRAVTEAIQRALRFERLLPGERQRLQQLAEPRAATR